MSGYETSCKGQEVQDCQSSKEITHMTFLKLYYSIQEGSTEEEVSYRPTNTQDGSDIIGPKSQQCYHRSL